MWKPKKLNFKVCEFYVNKAITLKNTTEILPFDYLLNILENIIFLRVTWWYFRKSPRNKTPLTENCIF